MSFLSQFLIIGCQSVCFVSYSSFVCSRVFHMCGIYTFVTHYSMKNYTSSSISPVPLSAIWYQCTNYPLIDFSCFSSPSFDLFILLRAFPWIHFMDLPCHSMASPSLKIRSAPSFFTTRTILVLFLCHNSSLVTIVLYGVVQ